jgi:hypothetical protein
MSTALATFKKLHGVATHRLAGAGHRYPVLAFFTAIVFKDGRVRAFTDVAAEYSFALLERRNKVTHGADELSACIALASANGIPWPADEPKKRKAKQ